MNKKILIVDNLNVGERIDTYILKIDESYSNDK